MGKATRFLKEEANTDLFSRVTGQSLRSSTMRDREFVNRFCGFQLLTLQQYRGEMDDFLANTLQHMNAIGEEKISELSSDFRKGLENNFLVFGEHAFRKHSQTQERRSVINASLWDVMATGLSKYDRSVVEGHAGQLRDAFYKLMENEEFIAAITYGTNDTRRVLSRFNMAQRMFLEVFGARPA